MILLNLLKEVQMLFNYTCVSSLIISFNTFVENMMIIIDFSTLNCYSIFLEALTINLFNIFLEDSIHVENVD